MATGAPTTMEAGRLMPELVAARGLAAVWVVLAHTLAQTLRGHAPLPEAVEYTRLVVDFFFVLSGFVLAHVYDPAWRAGRFRYPDFLSRRLARLYPLHLATLLAVAVLVGAGAALGLAPVNAHDGWGFVATLLLLHSTWATDDLAWNWPSWSVSAEWCAYLAIPAFFLAADRVKGTRVRIVVGLGLFVLCSAVATLLLGHQLVSLTFDGGAFRIVPSFFAGILLRRIFEEEPSLLAMTPRSYALIVTGVFGVCGVLVALNAPYDALWPAMVVLVAALASRATWTEPGVLRGPILAWLGELSYAIYLTHAIVLQALFAAAKILGVSDQLWQRALVGGLAVPTTLLASYVAYRIVEKPGRGVMARLLQRKPRATSAAAAPRTD
ncbi:acyltransferase family protein [Hansschlegelia sp. KR7-227]|uniref:acyltransferase family protein n=1 Tax=Hansschlegelia sp. KR7-227 TaxID=3400914 RepID=UPI003BFD61EB